MIGIVYFGVFLLSSYASRHAGAVSGRMGNVERAINVTFFLGAGFLFTAGAASWLAIPVLSILVFLGLYPLHNVRKPLNVAYISDQIDNTVMASGLSVESQLVILLGTVIAPVLGALADAFSVGVALSILGLSMATLAATTHAFIREIGESHWARFRSLCASSYSP